MLDFHRIKASCDKNSRISNPLVDQFLLYYVGEREGQAKRVAQNLLGFRHVTSQMPESWFRMLISQLLAHDLFRENGRINQIINHSDVQKRSIEEHEYLRFQIEHPWRFCFCSIEKYLLHDMYEMKDVITEEKFLLYSPGISETNTEAGIQLPLWFLLLEFNGECYQSYGPLAYFRGIQPFDLFFFARLIKPEILFQNEVQKVIESNPIPFSMLFRWAEIPVTYCRKDMTVFNKSEFHVKEISLERYEPDFIVEKKHPLYMLSLKRWHSFPHFAKCFFHAKKNLLVLTSMTKRGYDTLVSTLNKQGNQFPLNPEILATPTMLHMAKEVLNATVEMNPYEKHFAKSVFPKDQKELDKINGFLRELAKRLNAGKDYNIEELAK